MRASCKVSITNLSGKERFPRSLFGSSIANWQRADSERDRERERERERGRQAGQEKTEGMSEAMDFGGC